LLWSFVGPEETLLQRDTVISNVIVWGQNKILKYKLWGQRLTHVSSDLDILELGGGRPPASYIGEFHHQGDAE
jgi:hypothetical protein